MQEPSGSPRIAITPYSAPLSPLLSHPHMLTCEVAALADPLRHAPIDVTGEPPSFVVPDVTGVEFDQLVVGPPPPTLSTATGGDYVPWHDVSTALDREACIRFLDEPDPSLLEQFQRMRKKRLNVVMPQDPPESETVAKEIRDLPPLHALALPTVGIYSTSRSSLSLALQLSLVSELARGGARPAALTDDPYGVLFGITTELWAGRRCLPFWIENAIHAEQQRLHECGRLPDPPDIVLASSRHAVARFDTRVPTIEPAFPLAISRLAQPDFAVLIVRLADGLEFIRACINTLRDLHYAGVGALVLSPARWHMHLSNPPLEMRVGSEHQDVTRKRRRQLAGEFGLPTYILKPQGITTLVRFIVKAFGGEL